MRNSQTAIAGAYQIMGLPPGTDFKTVISKYRKLASSMHPDRFDTPDGKRMAEEKLKRLNNAKDVLYGHFAGRDRTHFAGMGCACQATNQTPTNEAPQPAAESKSNEKAKEKAGATSKPNARTRRNTESKPRPQTADRSIPTATKSPPSLPTHPGVVNLNWQMLGALVLLLILFADAIHVISTYCFRPLTVNRTHWSPPAQAPITAEKEKQIQAAFYAEETARTAYDERHRWDRQIDAMKARIDTDEKVIAALKNRRLGRDLNMAEKANLETAATMAVRVRAETSAERGLRETALDWKSAAEYLEQLQRAHPEIPPERLAVKQAPAELLTN